MLRILFAENDIRNVGNDGLFSVIGPLALDAPCRIRPNVRMMLFLYRLILYNMQISHV